MKKLLLTLVVAFLATATFAQMKGGIKAGLNMTSEKEEAGGASITNSGTSFHIGGYANFALSDVIAIQPELLYNSLDVEGDKINYLSIPVMFQYGFADNKFNVQAGPELGLLLSTDPSEYKDQDYLTGTNFSFNIGGGANFGKFNATLRYCIGLANIAGSTLTDAVSDYSIKASTFQISVGYQLFGE